MDKQSARVRAQEIVSRMTVEEKISQLLYDAPAIERLGIPAYNWWNEACHGVARAGVATVFPQSIGMAATFNPALVYEVADAISTEARAKYNRSVAYGDRGIFKGLTFWAPNINIFRDPRWGRGQETCGEDPFLTSAITAAFIKGLQGDGEFYKATACAKHFAGHSGPERLRHGFNAEISKKDLYETYLPAFYHAVKAGVAGVMGAYNRTNGEPCCASPTLMEILRKNWGFDGYFVSDCGAICDIYEGHHYTDDLVHAAAAALNAGCELNCGDAYLSLVEAYESDLVTEEAITDAAVRLYTIRVLLGEFEEKRPYADTPYSAVSCKAHKELNLRAAEETLVLLENKNGFLPLDPETPRRIAVVGPNAMSVTALEGNYNGHADEYVTVADGIRRVFPRAEITVADGAPLFQDERRRWDGFCDLESEGAAAAAGADVTVLCLGLDRGVEGEDLGYENEFTDYGDRKTTALPACQMKLAEAVCNACENVVVVVMCGSAADLGERVRTHAKAVIHAWYPGALGGLAVARAIAGAFSPSGKLPITFYSADTELPDMKSYDMTGRTYRFDARKPLYPFGYGLSYTRFVYGVPELTGSDKNAVRLAVNVRNDGSVDALEKVQCYARYTDSRTTTPRLQLCAVEPVFLSAGETKRVGLTVDRFWLKAVLQDGSRVDPDGGVRLFVGGMQPDEAAEGLVLPD
ncbi:MAG: glycoside hydrolase family 3 C-terminal domain-containing protein [Clostridia bacterium]|nr:glycoside hydrolase family 3 C-terminal domain-containing protein [Clostridia bacterium]